MKRTKKKIQILTNKMLEHKARSVLTKDKVIEYLQLHYRVAKEDLEGEYYGTLFNTLYSLTDREINFLVSKKPDDNTLKSLYYLVYYRKHRSGKASPARMRAYNHIKNI